MSTILVTGSAGFIGSNLVDKLLKKNFVIGIDNFDPYYSKKIKLRNIATSISNKNYKFIEMDIRSAKKMAEILREMNVEYVCHLAARPGVRNSFKNPKIYMENNLIGTISLLSACLNSDVKKIIYSSSSSVYGNPEYLPIDEKHPTNPISPYGVSKLFTEKYLNYFEKTYSVKSIILRYFTVYGPRQRPDESIFKFVNLLMKNKLIPIYGNGNQTRDFTYISDVIAGTELAIKKNFSKEIFNIGSDQRISVNEMIKILENLTKKKAKKKYYEKQKGDVTDTHSNIKKARQKLGYKPKINIENGIKLFYRWFKTNALDSNSGI